jgi:hypothetical protein
MFLFRQEETKTESPDLKSLGFEVIQSPARPSTNWTDQLFTNRSKRYEPRMTHPSGAVPVPLAEK